MKNKLIPYAFIIATTLFSCNKNNDYTIYHKFQDQTWKRFNILQFEIPVEVTKKTYDVVFFARISKDYAHDYLDFNMVMTTPSGEERIKEYRINIKNKTGSFLQSFTGDSCEYTINLKRGITLTKGTMILQIENLIPRLETNGLLGAGIKLHPLP